MSFKNLFSVLAISVLGLGISPVANASTASANLSVTATVDANCVIFTSPVAFGTYDPVGGSDLAGTGTVTTRCTKNSSVHVLLGQGANPDSGSSETAPLRQMASGAERLKYNLFKTGSHSTVWGNDNATGIALTGSGLNQATTVYGLIDGGQPGTMLPGAYTDTVVATVVF